jgi:hypothetical protein
MKMFMIGNKPSAAKSVVLNADGTPYVHVPMPYTMAPSYGSLANDEMDLIAPQTVRDAGAVLPQHMRPREESTTVTVTGDRAKVSEYVTLSFQYRGQSAKILNLGIASDLATFWIYKTTKGVSFLIAPDGKTIAVTMLRTFAETREFIAKR